MKGTSLFSSPSPHFQPGHKLLGCLILYVWAHITGVCTVCMPSCVGANKKQQPYESYCVMLKQKQVFKTDELLDKVLMMQFKLVHIHFLMSTISNIYYIQWYFYCVLKGNNSTPTHFSLNSSAIVWNPELFSSPNICCNRLRMFLLSAFSC